jgi:hypothetical protein
MENIDEIMKEVDSQMHAGSETEQEWHQRLDMGYSKWFSIQSAPSTFAYKILREHENYGGTSFRIRSTKENLAELLNALPEKLGLIGQYVSDVLLDMAEARGKSWSDEKLTGQPQVQIISAHRLDRKHHGPWATDPGMYEVQIQIQSIDYSSVDKIIQGLYGAMKEVKHINEINKK